MIKRLKYTLFTTVITFCIGYRHLSIQSSEQKVSSMNKLNKTIIASGALFIGNTIKSPNKLHNNSLNQITPCINKHEIASEDNTNNMLVPMDIKDNTNELGFLDFVYVQPSYNNAPGSIDCNQLNEQNNYSTHAQHESSMSHNPNNIQPLTLTPESNQTNITTVLKIRFQNIKNKFCLMQKQVNEQNQNILDCIKEQNISFQEQNRIRDQRNKNILNFIKKKMKKNYKQSQKNTKNLYFTQKQNIRFEEESRIRDQRNINIFNLIQEQMKEQNERFEKQNQENKKTVNFIQKQMQDVKQIADKIQKDIKELNGMIEQQKQNNTNQFKIIEKTIQAHVDSIQKDQKTNTDSIRTIVQGMNFNTQYIQTVTQGQNNNTKYILILAQKQNDDFRTLLDRLTDTPTQSIESTIELRQGP